MPPPLRQIKSSSFRARCLPTELPYSNKHLCSCRPASEKVCRSVCKPVIETKILVATDDNNNTTSYGFLSSFFSFQNDGMGVRKLGKLMIYKRNPTDKNKFKRKKTNKICNKYFFFFVFKKKTRIKLYEFSLLLY